MATYLNICRLCTKKTKSSIRFDHCDSDKIKYFEKLKFVFNDLVLIQDNVTPFQLCPSCCKNLKQAYEFKKQCISSYDYWQMHFINNVSIKQELDDECETKVDIVKKPNNGDINPSKDYSQTNVSIKHETQEDEAINTVNKYIQNQIPKRGRPKKNNTERSLVAKKCEDKMGAIHPVNKKDQTPSILNIKSKLSALLKSDAVVNTENPTKTLPLQLCFTSLKSKLGEKLKIGNKDFGTVNISPARKKLLKQRYFFISSSYVIDKTNKQFYCTSCNKYFDNVKPFKEHIVKELRIKKISCQLCRKKFFSPFLYKLHLEDHI